MKDNTLIQGVEVTVIGTLVKHPETFRQVRETLRPDMFLSDQGQAIAAKVWAAMTGGKWNRNVFAASLSKLESVNIESAMNAADPDNLTDAGDILRAMWEQDVYKAALSDAALNYEAFDTWKEADERMNEARRLIMQTGGGRAESPEVIIDDITQDLIDGIRGKKEYCGIPTGFPLLDDMVGGWQPGQQIIVAARPGQGKTRSGVQFAYAAAKSGVPVVFYSREIKARQIYRYVLSFMAAVPVSLMKSYSLDSNSIDEIGRAADLLKTMPLYVIDDAATVEDVRYSMLEMAAHKGAKLFVLDYVQLLTSTATKKSDNRNNELAHISRTLKLTAMQTDAANIVIAQLNRETEKRAGKRPQLSDLRDSGALEADADVVIFPFDPAKNKMQGQGELIVEKQRDGKTGSIPVDWKEPGFFYPAQDFDPVQFAPAADSWNTLKINGIKPHDEEDVPF